MLNGDVDNAICLHAFYYAIWKRFGALPERYNWQLQAPDVLFYPLRPELVESTYLLYQVTDLTCQIIASVFVVCCKWLLSLLQFSCRQQKILSICTLEWIFFRAWRKMPKSGGDYVVLTFFGTFTRVWNMHFKVSCVVCRCGYATLHHVVDKSKEDRMESFFLSETCKYLYLVGYSVNLS